MRISAAGDDLITAVQLCLGREVSTRPIGCGAADADLPPAVGKPACAR
jgi:hypothetical protein